MSKKESKIIAIREKPGQQPRKLTKIIEIVQGFAVVTPFYKVQNGIFGKVPVDYNIYGETKVADEDVISFTTTTRVKLSYHLNGFVQFSGEYQGKVISGFDQNKGEAKGVGLMSQPLSDPIRSGPSFGVQAWGLENFDETSDSDDAVVFEPEDLYFRDSKPNMNDGYSLEVFVFPKSYWSAVHKHGPDYILTMVLPSHDAPYATFEMKVIYLPNQEVLLAGIMSNHKVSYPSKSGWSLNGPGTRDSSGKGYVLMAWYPDHNKQGQNSPSLDYLPNNNDSEE